MSATSGITTVELFHRIGRRARGGDFTKLSMTEQTDLAEAANAALQRLYNALPVYFKEQTQGFVLPAPATVANVGVTQFGKTVTGISFTAAEFGQTILLDGDAAWNQIIGTTDLLTPYMGPTGTVGGTIYGSAIYSDTYPMDRVIGNPRFANMAQAPIAYQRDIVSGNVSDAGAWLLTQTVGMPRMCWTQVFGGSQGKSPLMVLKFAPVADQAYAINVRLSFWPKRITLADYDSATFLPIPDQFIEPSLIPMALQSFMSSPAWLTKGDEAAVEQRGAAGELYARNQPGQIGSPNNRIFTPIGF
jgi:hypothetical protein